jgi:3-methyl-2-oxobutanoate hydroxymethyltransferase
MSSSQAEAKNVTILDLLTWKQEKRKIVAITAYDALFGRLVDASGVDVVLVGDSVNQVIAGNDSTLSATVDQMIYHARMVRRGVKRALLVVDMPFLSYQISPEDALRNCGRVMKETGANAVKIEGGQGMAPTVRALVDAGMPVMGHIGLTPQSYHQLGGFKVQGRDPGGRERLLADARVLEDAGVYSIVLEAIPADIAYDITAAVSVPTIGIGAGTGCDGQVLVSYDALGMDETFKPRFVRRYATLGETIKDAIGHYIADVRDGSFPSDAESFTIAESKAAPGALEPVYSTAAQKH